MLAGQYDMNHWDIKKLLFPVKMHCFASVFQLQQLRKKQRKTRNKNMKQHVLYFYWTSHSGALFQKGMFDEKKSAAGLQSLFH